MITIIDYGAGNLRSVVNAVRHLGFEPKVTGSPADLGRAEAVILPGVGAAADTMKSLADSRLVEPIREVIGRGRPFLGICIGLQVLFSFSQEGECPCLDVVPGKVKRLPGGLKIPHMGWNQVRQKVPHPLFAGIPDNANFYFVHSYYAKPAESSVVIGETGYGISFCSVIARDNLLGTQFHPEKSGELGLRMYTNFFKIAGLKAK